MKAEPECCNCVTMKLIYVIIISLVSLNLSAKRAGVSEIHANFGYVVSNYTLKLNGGGFIPVTEGDPAGISFGLGGNWNFYNTQKEVFGLDLNSNFNANFMSDTIVGGEVELDHTQFDLSVRPFWRIGDIHPYVIFGIGYNSFDLSDGFNSFDKGTAFAPRFGFGVSINLNDFIYINPYFNWTYAKAPSIEVLPNQFLELDSSSMFEFGLPVFFDITENFSLGFELKHINMSPWEESMYGISGTLEFHETLFLVRSDLVF